MRIAVGADHAGYELKDRIVGVLRREGHEVEDMGTSGPESVDYTHYAVLVGRRIREGCADRGILVCGSGVGVSIAANKLRGIRAALCHDMYSAHQSVEHDDANVLCIGPRVIGPELAMDLVRVWIGARFTSEERHVRRVSQVCVIEESEANASP